MVYIPSYIPPTLLAYDSFTLHGVESEVDKTSKSTSTICDQVDRAGDKKSTATESRLRLQRQCGKVFILHIRHITALS